MPASVFISGTGIITAIGNNTGEVFGSLKACRSGIGPILCQDTIHRGKIPVASVKRTTEELLRSTLHPEGSVITRTALLGMTAAMEAIENAGIRHLVKSATGLISATTTGGMDRSEHFFASFLQDPGKGRLRDVVHHDCGESTERIAGYTGIRDFVTTISTACSSSANAIMLGAELIRAGFLERVVAGGTDAMTRFTLNGFNTLMILDKDGCKPFDENRAGLTLGEGAAYLVLESERSLQERGGEPLAELTGWGNANDAFHQTASSPEGTGATLAMERAIALSGLTPAGISYINVHGTGTQNNDLSEGTAIEKVFGKTTPPFSSTKSYTGHTLGAAGSVEAVISILSILHGMIFPNLNWTTPMKELSLRPVTTLLTGLKINTVLSNSFGFGGNNSTLIFSNPSILSDHRA